VRIASQLQALRQDDRPQREAQAAIAGAMESLQATPQWLSLQQDMEAYGAGTDLAELPQLSCLANGDGSARLADLVLRQFLPVQAKHHLAHLPFRHAFDGTLSSMQLARSGRAMLTLVSLEPGSHPSTAASFADGTRHDVVLAGRANGRFLRRNGAAIRAEAMEFNPGACLSLDLSRESIAIEQIHSRLVLLRLRRDAVHPQPTRQYSLEDGNLLQQSAGDMGESRKEAMLALLGRMSRKDAAPVMGEMTREGSEHLRWQALREYLALDTARGFAALGAIARDQADPLSGPAGALRAQLLEEHPQLAALEDQPCPA
jgi:hypothetical protein